MTDVPRPSEYDLAFAILAAATDPARSKAWLEELIAKEKSLKELTEALNEARSEHHSAHANATAAKFAAKTERESLDVRAREIEQKSADLSARENRVTQRESNLAAKIKQVDVEHEQHSVALSAREARVTDREAAIEKRENAHAAAEAAHAERVESLRKLVG